MKGLVIFLVLIFIASSIVSQTFTLRIEIANQPENTVFLGQIKGDKFMPVDSVKVQSVTFNSPAESGQKDIRLVSPGNKENMLQVTFHLPEAAPTGMYRLILGKTRIAEIMNEPPQQLDFIFNHENMVFETDFKAPEDSLKIIESEENRVWFAFKKQEGEVQGAN